MKVICAFNFFFIDLYSVLSIYKVCLGMQQRYSGICIYWTNVKLTLSRTTKKLLFCEIHLKKLL